MLRELGQNLLLEIIQCIVLGAFMSTIWFYQFVFFPLLPLSRGMNYYIWYVRNIRNT